MVYTFNPHRHAKIWLSTKPDLFMTIENQLRLVAMRQKNPDDDIHLIYARDLLSPKAQQDLAIFCKRNNIIPVSIEDDIIPNCETENEKALIACYQQEIDALKEGGGNPAAASDILRWISPVYKLGVYADFDVEIDTKKLAPTKQVNSAMLLNLGSVSVPGVANVLSFNNDVIAIVDGDAAREQVEAVQRSILNAYRNDAGDFSYNAYTRTCIEELSQRIPQTFVNLIESVVDSHTRSAVELDRMQAENETKFLTPIDLRAQLKHEKNNEPDKFIVRALKTLGLQHEIKRDDDSTKVAAQRFRQYLRNKTGWFAWLTMPRHQYKSIRAKIYLNDAELVKTMLDDVYTSLYMHTVIGSTGPTVMLMALFKQALFDSQPLNTIISPYAFSEYGFEQAFQLDNGLPLGSSAYMALVKLATTDKPGEIGDISWIDKGAEAQKSRGEIIKENIRKLPTQFLELRTEIEAHKKAIQGDLNGWFGFYRHNARVAKISALDEVLSFFEDDSFDVAGFTQAVQQFEEKYVGLDAALGKSKTQALIVKCQNYALMAMRYAMIDENAPKEMARLQKLSLVDEQPFVYDCNII